MNCNKCGATIPEGSDKCPECGNPVVKVKKPHYGRKIVIAIVILFFYWVLIDSIPNKTIAIIVGAGTPIIFLLAFQGEIRKHFRSKKGIPEEPAECAEEDPPAFGLDDIDAMEGHQFEYWSAEMLRNQGFHNVTVTPGSGDQGVDVLAEKDGIRYAVQCKCYSSNLGNTPVQEVHAGKKMYHCHVGVVLTNQYFTDGAKQLAEVTDTLLWDRDYLREYLDAQ